MALKTELVRGADQLTDQKRKQLSDIGRLARDTAHKVRETVWIVNTEYDSVLGLVKKMRDTTHTLLDGHLEVEFRAPEELPKKPLDMELRQDFYLLFKEILQNILKHAEASNVDVQVRFQAPHMSVSVRDDGKGFDPDEAAGRAGNGIVMMRRRAAKHRGTVEIDSRPGDGTTVRLSVRT